MKISFHLRRKIFSFFVAAQFVNSKCYECRFEQNMPLRALKKDKQICYTNYILLSSSTLRKTQYICNCKNFCLFSKKIKRFQILRTKEPQVSQMTAIVFQVEDQTNVPPLSCCCNLATTSSIDLSFFCSDFER